MPAFEADKMNRQMIRMYLVREISRCLRLDAEQTTRFRDLFRDIDVTDVTVADIQKNLDFLQCRNSTLLSSEDLEILADLDLRKGAGFKYFSREDLASCPLVLAHPHGKLALMVEELSRDGIGGNSSRRRHDVVVASDSSSLQHSAGNENVYPRFYIRDFLRDEDRKLYLEMESEPKVRINALQYFLERERSFRTYHAGSRRSRRGVDLASVI